MPRLREQLEQWTRTNLYVETSRVTLEQGLGSIAPQGDARAGATVMAWQEAERLRQASLYYVTPDMSALAVAAGATPPIEPARLDRAPSPYGLVVFGSPVGSYVQTDTHIPIVAMSWGPWTTSDWPPPEAPPGTPKMRWLGRMGLTEGGELQKHRGRLPEDWGGMWVSFYSPSHLRSLIGVRDGFVPPTISADNEAVLCDGGGWAEPVPNTTSVWLHVLYTTWQMMSQTGASALAESEILPRRKGQAKTDVRAGYTPGDVRIVDVHQTIRPARAARAQDEAASDRRRAVEWSCRWPVRPHRRDHCMNPRAHADGGCTHQDRIIRPYVKGPADKPLVARQTVNVWSDVPEDVRT